jgi:hypothetical protein
VTKFAAAVSTGKAGAATGMTGDAGYTAGCTQAASPETIAKAIHARIFLPPAFCAESSKTCRAEASPSPENERYGGIARRSARAYHCPMFTIEHEFDATVITLVDEGDRDMPLQEDVIIEAFEDCVVIRQIDEMTDEPQIITLSMAQLQDLAAALDLPEGSYRIERKPTDDTAPDRG